MRFFRLHLLAEGLIEELPVLFHLLQAFFYHFWEQCRFTGRVNAHLFQVFNGTLALRVKTAHGINLIPPQFNPVRVFLRQRENIQDTAPYGKLPCAFYLVIPLVAHLDEARLYAFHIQGIPQGIAQNPFLHQRGGRHTVHQGVKGSDNSDTGLL